MEWILFGMRRAQLNQGADEILEDQEKVMVIALATHIPGNDIVRRIHAVSTGKWWGCNWPTAFGPMNLDLENVRARQARLLAEATSGKESECWRAAARYLSQVEYDAAVAEQLASEAVHYAALGQLSESLKLIEDVVNLEAKYRTCETWKPLRDALALAQNTTVINETEVTERSISGHADQ